jgi:hypothetical protein
MRLLRQGGVILPLQFPPILYLSRAQSGLEKTQANHQHIPGVGDWPLTERDTPGMSLNENTKSPASCCHDQEDVFL